MSIIICKNKIEKNIFKSLDTLNYFIDTLIVRTHKNDKQSDDTCIYQLEWYTSLYLSNKDINFYISMIQCKTIKERIICKRILKHLSELHKDKYKFLDNIKYSEYNTITLIVILYIFYNSNSLINDETLQHIVEIIININNIVDHNKIINELYNRHINASKYIKFDTLLLYNVISNAYFTNTTYTFKNESHNKLFELLNINNNYYSIYSISTQYIIDNFNSLLSYLDIIINTTNIYVWSSISRKQFKYINYVIDYFKYNINYNNKYHFGIYVNYISQYDTNEQIQQIIISFITHRTQLEQKNIPFFIVNYNIDIIKLYDIVFTLRINVFMMKRILSYHSKCKYDQFLNILHFLCDSSKIPSAIDTETMKLIIQKNSDDNLNKNNNNIEELINNLIHKDYIKFGNKFCHEVISNAYFICTLLELKIKLTPSNKNKLKLNLNMLQFLKYNQLQKVFDMSVAKSIFDINVKTINDISQFEFRKLFTL